MTERELFVAALHLQDAARVAFLQQACANDRALRDRVEALLYEYERLGSFLEPSAPASSDATVTRAPEFDPNATTDQPGENLGAVIAGKYKLVELIGEGGMGSVWMAQQSEPVKRFVAVKLIKTGMNSKAVLARFEAERQALAVMDHPNIAKILDGGMTDGEPGRVSAGRPFFVMELVKGVPITAFCDARKLTPKQRLELFVPVCQAIQHAHQKGIIHRDIKPSNVLIALYDDKPVPKVIDFGIAKATGQALTDSSHHTAFGGIVGTPEYMSPEQANLNNLDIDTRSDVYSLGVLLYELLAGSPPFRSTELKQAGMLEMLRVVREEEPPRPSNKLSTANALPSISANRGTEPKKLTGLLRNELDWIVMKALEKDRARRYETANGFAADVQRYLTGEAVQAHPPSAGYRMRKFIRRHKGRVVAAGLLTLMLFLIVGLIVYGAWWAERNSAERQHEQELAAAHKNDTFKATLNQIETALKSARLAEAVALLGQGDKQLDEQTPSDLRERHERLQKDERTVWELNDIFEERWMMSPSDTRLDSERAKRRYPILFKSYGLAMGMEPAATTVEKIRQAVIEETLSSAMTEWFFVDPKYPGLLAVVDLLDAEPTRVALRRAISNEETDRIRELAKTIDGSCLPPAFAIGLGIHPATEDPQRILKAAWTAHPDSFPLVLTISTHLPLMVREQVIEAIGWSRAAVSLRPNNPLAHYYLAGALNYIDLQRTDVAPIDDQLLTQVLEELRRTVQFAPKFARPYGRMAFLLHFTKKNGRNSPDALEAARKAIDLDSDNLLGRLVLFSHFLDKRQYLEAAQQYRRLCKLQSSESGLHPSDEAVYNFMAGVMSVLPNQLVSGLLASGRPFEAYRVVHDGGRPPQPMPSPDQRWKYSAFYNAACAAALAGTGKGLDAPPAAERPAIRDHAREWLNAYLDIRKKDAAALPVLGTSTLGLMGSPLGYSSHILAVFTFAARNDNGAAEQLEVIHEEMSHLLTDPDLAGVRDEHWFAMLPAKEQSQWRKLWGEIQSLRDRTMPRKIAPTNGK